MFTDRTANYGRLAGARCAPLLSGVLGVALAVVAVLGLDRSQPGPSRRLRSASWAAQPVQAHARPPSGAVAARRRPAAASAVTGTHGPTTIYQVDTAEQARTLQAWLGQGQFGVPGGAPANAEVVRLPSAPAEAMAQAAQWEQLSAAGALPWEVAAQPAQRR